MAAETIAKITGYFFTTLIICKTGILAASAILIMLTLLRSYVIILDIRLHNFIVIIHISRIIILCYFIFFELFHTSFIPLHFIHHLIPNILIG